MTDELKDPLKDAWYVNYPETTARNVTNGTGNYQDFTPIRDAMVGKKMTDELKPVRCGCGGEAELCDCDQYESYSMLFWVACPNCGISTESYDTETEAVTAWNRAMGKNPVKVDVVTAKNGRTWEQCSRCLNEVYYNLPYCPGCGAKLDWSRNE